MWPVAFVFGVRLIANVRRLDIEESNDGESNRSGRRLLQEQR